MTASRIGIPAREVERSVDRRGLVAAPRVGLFIAVWRSERRPLELRFGGQTQASPACVGTRFCLAVIDRPRERQRDQLEHAAPEPASVVPLPEKRVAHLFVSQPPPILWPPPLVVVVTAGVDEFEIPAVRHVVARD